LDDLAVTEDSGSSPRLQPSICLSKVDSGSTKDEVHLERVKPLPAKIFKSPKQKTLLGKRQRSDIDNELNKLFEDSAELKGMTKHMSCSSKFEI
jgi:hypothetical protein